MLLLSGLLIEQGLTNTLLLLAISYSMMIVGGVKFTHLLVLSLAYLALGALFIGYLVWSDSRSKEIPADAEQEIELVADGSAKKNPSRLDTWIARVQRHSSDSIPKWDIPATGKNRQEILSYMAQAHGGIHSVGPSGCWDAHQELHRIATEPTPRLL